MKARVAQSVGGNRSIKDATGESSEGIKEHSIGNGGEKLILATQWQKTG